MNSAPVFSRGSTQVLGNMPFSSEFATGSALHDTDMRLNALYESVSGVNFQLKTVESTRPTRDEIHQISGHYANHEEVREWAKYASANAKAYTDDEIDDLEERANGKIDSLSGECFHNDELVLTSAYDYTEDVVLATSSFLLNRFDKAINDEIIERTAAVSGEKKRAEDEEYRIETKFDGLCATLSSDLSAVSAISKAEDERIDRRIDRYEQVFSAVLDDVSAVAYHADQENKFVNFLNDAGIVYSSAAHTMYLGNGKLTPVDFSVSGDLKTSGDLTTKNIAANNISSNDIRTKSIVTDNIDTISFVAGSGNNVIAYDGGDTVEFGNATVSVNPGSVVYKFDPAVSYEGRRIKVGVPTASDTVSSISIGGANADKNNSIVIATPGTSIPGAVSNREGSITFYTPSDENGVFIGTSSVPEIITKYAPSREELEEEVQDEIKNASGIIRSGIQEEVETAVSARIRSTELNLSAYVNEETQKRIDDVQSVRDELPFYLHTSGGTIWGDLTVNNVNLFDLFSGSQQQLQYLYSDEIRQPVSFVADWSRADIGEWFWEYDGWNLAFSSGIAAMAKPTNGIGMVYGDSVLNKDTAFRMYRANDVSAKFPQDPYEDITTSSYTYTEFKFVPLNGDSTPYFSFVLRPPSAQSEEDIIIEYLPSSTETSKKYPYLRPCGNLLGNTYMMFDFSGTSVEELQYMLSNAEESVVLYTPVSVLLNRIENNCEPETIKIKVEVSGEVISENVESHEQHFVGDVHYTKLLDCSYIESERIYEGNGIKVLLDENKISATDYLIDITIGGAVHSAPINFVCEPFGSVTLAQYINDQTRLTKHMLDVTTSAHNTAVSAYSVAVSAYDTATEAHDLIVQAQGVVASASNTATSAYNIAMSAYALSGVLQEVADYLRDINGEG